MRSRTVLERRRDDAVPGVAGGRRRVDRELRLADPHSVRPAGHGGRPARVPPARPDHVAEHLGDGGQDVLACSYSRDSPQGLQL